MENSIDEQIDELETKISELKKQKNKEVSNEILAGLIEGHFYKLHFDGRTILYFKYTPSNVFVKDGTGTVGYNGTHYVTIIKGLYRWFTNFSGIAGCFNTKTFDVRDFNNPFENLKFIEISKEDFEKEREEIIKDIMNS